MLFLISFLEDVEILGMIAVEIDIEINENKVNKGIAYDVTSLYFNSISLEEKFKYDKIIVYKIGSRKKVKLLVKEFKVEGILISSNSFFIILFSIFVFSLFCLWMYDKNRLLKSFLQCSLQLYNM